MRYLGVLAVVVGTMTLAAACAPEAEPETEHVGEAESAISCSVPFSIDPSRSLFVTKDATVLARFSFKKVMDKILATANVASPTSSRTLFRTWMDSNNDAAGAVISTARHCDSSLTDPEGFGFSCPRPAEGDMAINDAAHSPFSSASQNFFEPVAVVNRFDLAPTNGANCGEHRVVYAKTTGAGRFFIIFEAALPNPDPAAGLAACAPIVDAWRSLSDPAMTATQRADKLDAMYFTGISGFAPVVKAEHYGFQTGGKGQIRTNQFMDSEWMLREFKTARTCSGTTCTLSIKPVTVKANPAEDLMKSAHPDNDAFTTNFLASVAASRLLATDVDKIKLATAGTWNTWESNTANGSSTAEVVYRNHADAAFKTSIQTKLTSLGSTLTPSQVLNRAMTQTCAGCHQNANGAGLGGGLTWPASRGFVHVDENGDISGALTTHFLPHRKGVMESFIAGVCDGAAPAAPPPEEGLTVGGSLEDSPN